MMIVPQTRLLLWVAVVLLPAAIIGAVFPVLASVAALSMVALISLAVLDLALSAGRLQDLDVKAPDVIRLFKDRDGIIELELVNPGKQSRTVRIGLALAPDTGSKSEDMIAALPDDAERSRVDWLCRPKARGSYELKQCYLEEGSRFGMWLVRGRRTLASEVRVYPNLHDERRQVAALFLNRGNYGMHARRQVGKGRDFEKLREYVPGDDYDEIHWKATAKRGRPVTKVFQIERTQEVYVIVDASRLTARKALLPALHKAVAGGSTEDSTEGTEIRETTVLERFINAALLLGVAAEQQGDLFGMATFSDRPKLFLRARNGTSHYDTCRDALYTLEPEAVSPDFDELAVFLKTRLRRRALLVFLTALDDPVVAEGFIRGIEVLSRQHLVMVNMIPPTSIRPLFSEEGGVRSVDDVYRELGGHLQWQKLRELQKVLQRRGVRLSLLDQERLSAQLVTQYLEVKQRQIL
ncbi:MAG TPA: DUF58 domain-containing protein [Roseimicrobium sp.]|nr:DUF58 domain-containing protein [Roseimicrobium sp.]